MCGIVGLVSRIPFQCLELLAAMQASLRHRGPDDAGTWCSAEGCVGLAHRLLAMRALPSQLNLARKQGFALPLDSWFRGNWGQYLEDILLNGHGDLFDRQAVRRVIASQRRGYRNTQRLLALALFELWRREYGVTV